MKKNSHLITFNFVPLYSFFNKSMSRHNTIGGEQLAMYKTTH